MESSIALDARSGLVTVRGDVPLEHLEDVLQRHEMSLGPLSPRMRLLHVREFIEGPYAGLCVTTGGRLEPICLSLAVELPDGTRYQSHASPRSAAGPDLDALFIGGKGRHGHVVSSVLRVVERADAQAHLEVRFTDAARALAAIKSSIAQGVSIRSWSAEKRADGVLIELDLLGKTERLGLDRSTLEMEAGRNGGHLAQRMEVHLDSGTPPGSSTEGAAPDEERELTWEELLAVIASGVRVKCWRSALETIVVAGAGERGMSLAWGDAWSTPEVLSAIRPLESSR